MSNKITGSSSGAIQLQSGLPSDLVTVGYITGAFGVHGWVKIHPYSSDAHALLHAKIWWLGKPGARADEVTSLCDVERLEAKRHGEGLVARLMGFSGREAAESLKGSLVQIRRCHFPVLPKNEFYWLDLIGLSVENLQGESLGVVVGLIESGAHPVLRVAPSSESSSGEKSGLRPQECLIPFVDHIVPVVDEKNKKIIVDWGLDY